MAPKAKLPDLKQEALLWEQGSAFVFGVDEAGRGCLAGPVCAAVSCWAPFSSAFGYPAEVRDSKVMTEIQRNAAFGPVSMHAFTHGVGYATAPEIDQYNIFKATHLAVARALEAALASLSARALLSVESIEASRFAFLTDGNFDMVTRAGFFLDLPRHKKEFPHLRALYRGKFLEIPVVKGDSKVFSIASASVLAKVSRDRWMKKLHRKYPAYDFESHKGYSTPKHLEMLRAEGPCSEHRRSFSPISESLSLF